VQPLLQTALHLERLLRLVQFHVDGAGRSATAGLPVQATALKYRAGCAELCKQTNAMDIHRWYILLQHQLF
jgi:hypothetical protein